MPLVFRAMLANGERPKIDASKKTLGVVPGDGERDDLPIDERGMVAPRTGGMSVAPSWQKLPPFLIPMRLSDQCPKASGNNKLSIWRLGEGPFVESPVTDRLVLVPDRSDHGTIQPSIAMLLSELQSELAQTVNSWTNIEG